MMSTHFTAILGILRAHLLFYKSMPALTENSSTIQFLHDVQSVPSQTGIVNNSKTRSHPQHGLSNESNNVIALNKIRLFVKEETSIVIPVPSNPKIIVTLLHQGNRTCSRFFKNWVGNPVRKVSIRFKKSVCSFKRQVG